MPAAPMLDGPPSAEAIVAAFGLDGRAVALVPVSGAWSHRVYRLQTTGGAFAVKELRNPWGDPDWQAWLAAAWEFELAALDAGVAMPRPVANPGDGGCLAWVSRKSADPRMATAPVRLHHWVDGDQVDVGPVRHSVATWAGHTLARLHGLAIGPRDPTVFPVTGTASAQEWPRLVARARRAQAPWTDLLVAAQPAVHQARTLFERDAGSPDVMSHGDIDQKNLLMSAGGPILCDWDVAAPVVPRQELADVALSLAAWHDLDVTREVVRAYRAEGGPDEPLRPTDFGRSFMVTLDWISMNAERVLGARPSTPDEVARSTAILPGLLEAFPRQVAVAAHIASLLA